MILGVGCVGGCLGLIGAFTGPGSFSLGQAAMGCSVIAFVWLLYEHDSLRRDAYSLIKKLRV